MNGYCTSRQDWGLPRSYFEAGGGYRWGSLCESQSRAGQVIAHALMIEHASTFHFLKLLVCDVYVQRHTMNSGFGLGQPRV